MLDVAKFPRPVRFTERIRDVLIMRYLLTYLLPIAQEIILTITGPTGTLRITLIQWHT